jgi:hypothetical protein
MIDVKSRKVEENGGPLYSLAGGTRGRRLGDILPVGNGGKNGCILRHRALEEGSSTASRLGGCFIEGSITRVAFN